MLKYFLLQLPGEEVQYVMFMSELLMTTCELKLNTKLNLFLFCTLVSCVVMFDEKSHYFYLKSSKLRSSVHKSVHIYRGEIRTYISL